MFVRLAIFACLLAVALADTPANCTYEDVLGDWLFQVGPAGQTNQVNCSANWPVVVNRQITLKYPDIAVDQDGLRGFWTLIYNQGFEVVIGNVKYFAFSYYSLLPNGTVVSACGATFNGWSHNVDGSDWACYRGYKANAPADKVSHMPATSARRYVPDEAFVKRINSMQSSWTATLYPEYQNMTMAQLQQRAGARAGGFDIPSMAGPMNKINEQALPDSFDWRNVGGVSYVSPIRNQGSCGSCYAFASAGTYEARLRVLSNNTRVDVISTQAIVSCSPYSQGCDGGFPYLIGKYADDFGLVTEDCYPYEGRTTTCMPLKPSCPRLHATDYHYIGGFYGACTEPAMRQELIMRGPIAVSFQVYDDFMQYKSGIYHHTAALSWNPWEITNHVVVIVGYGSENGQAYWIVKNSWGASWGENGFFRIRRGNDECSIESIAVAFTPIL